MGTELHGVSVEVSRIDGENDVTTIRITQDIRSLEIVCVYDYRSDLDHAQDVAAHVYNETLRQINEIRTRQAAL